MTWRNTILVGDVRERLRDLPDESVHCVVTSPPYWGLRDYGTEGQLGLEPTPEQFVCNLVAVFREVKRVLRKDGTLWLNLGDSYHNGDKGGYAKDRVTATDSMQRSNLGANFIGAPNRQPQKGLKPKDLVGQPWRVAFALQADGWYLRSDIIWAKPNPMPESVTDRPTKAHEYLFLLAKSPRYFYDAQAILERAQSGPSDVKKMLESRERIGGLTKEQTSPLLKASALTNIGNKRAVGGKQMESAESAPGSAARRMAGFNDRWDESEAKGHVTLWRNRRTVWEIPTEPYAEAHFATYPTALVLPCIQAGTSEHGCCAECGAPWRRVLEVVDTERRLGVGYHDHTDDLGRGQRGVPAAEGAPTKRTVGWAATCKHHQPGAGRTRAVVLDPFMGSGTTAAVAKKAGRDYVGVEMNPEYVAMAKRRIGDQGGLL